MERMNAVPTKSADPQTSSLSDASEELLVDKRLERRAVLKLDYTVLPVMTMLYFLSFLVSRFFFWQWRV
jgi:hypothetical protein